MAVPFNSLTRTRLGKRQLVLLILAAIFVVLYQGSQRSSTISSSLLPASATRKGEKQFDDLILRPADRSRERVTLVSVFGGNKPATYLPMFFQTVGQNSGKVDLLFVNVDQGEGCMDLSYVTDPKSLTYMPNIKVLCLSELENDKYYEDFICNGWGGCNADTREKVKNHLTKIRKEAIDEIFNTFKPFRGLVYEKHLRTSWWAWCDADQLIGSFEHLFPWDMINNFDLILTQGYAQAPKALFMSGQLTFFRINEKMRKMPFRYKALSSPEFIHELKPGDHLRSLDEGEYSDMYLNKLPEVDVLRLADIMGPEPGFGDRRIVLADGHILSGYRHISREDIQLYFNMLQDPDARNYRVSDSLTKHGVTRPIGLHNEVVMWCNGDRWNPINTCPDWMPSYSTRNFMYRKGGTWKIRRDVRLNPQHEWWPNAVEPKMFIHFLQMKREADDFKLPTMSESGYEEQRRLNGNTQDLLKHPGKQIAALELTRDWAGRWMMTVDSKQSPRGFEWTHHFMKKFWTNNDHYFPYHEFRSEEEWPGQGPPPDPWHHVINVAEVVPPP